MKKLLKNIVCVLFIFATMSISAFAENPFPKELTDLQDQLKSTLDKTPLSECRSKVSTIYDIELLKFYNFLEGHFRNKSSTSSLTNIAVARFIEYRTSIRSTFALLTPSASSSNNNYEEELTAHFICRQVTDLYISKAKDMMMSHIRKTIGQKRSSLFAEKFKGLDSKMRDFNLEISLMSGYLTTFKNKLPGFLRQCIVK